MPYNFGPYLDQLIAQRGQRPLADPAGQGQCAQEIANIICQGEQLQPHLVVPEVTTRQPRPRQRDLSLLDPLLGGPALVVKPNHVLGSPFQVGHDEADAREQLVMMPFDLGHHSPRPPPTLGLIYETMIENPGLVGWPTDRPDRQVLDLSL